MDIKKSAFIETNGIQLHVVQSGPEHGPLVILLHGFPEFWYGWQKQIEPLAQSGLRVWAPDQRGYNLSDKPSGLPAYRLDELAHDILGLISAAGREQAYIVGHDWGAIVAWWLGIHYPGRIKKLVILNGPHPKVFQKTLSTHPDQWLRSTYAAFFQIPFLPEATLRNKDWQLVVETLRNSSQPGTFLDEDIERYRQAWWKKGAMTCMLNWYRSALRQFPNLGGDLIVRPPALILWGARDAALRSSMAEDSLKYCQDGRLVMFEDATHWLQHEKPGEINDLIINFLVDPGKSST